MGKSEFNVRRPAVAGMFYPSDKNQLKKQIEDILKIEISKIKTELVSTDIIGGVVPHAGYIYSGYEASHFFEIVRQSKKSFSTVIILNPDHHGFSPSYATTPHSEWETPLGKLTIDNELAEYFPKSEKAHRDEHSAEVMLPFIQTFFGDKVNVLPISIGYPVPEVAEELAKKIQKAVEETKREILVIASSDFSHYVTPQEGEKLDNLALAKILSLDSHGLFQTIRHNGITICGYGPIMTLIEYSKLVTEKPIAKIAARGNSGKNSDSTTVVDYITILFSAQ